MNTAKRALVTGLMAAALLTTSFGFVVQNAHATQIDQNTSGSQTKKGLEDAGYTCVVVGVGFYECTKTGDTKYWCDSSGACQPAPARTKQTPDVKMTPRSAASIEGR